MIRFHLRQLIEQIKYLFRFLYKKKPYLDLLPLDDDFLPTPSVIRDDGLQIRANMWGLFKVPEKYRYDFDIWISKKGWVFETPKKNFGVIGYPAIIFQQESRRIGDIKKYTIEYNSDLKVDKYRKFNTSFDFWIGSKPHFDFPNIQCEIMIWDNYFVAKPFGKFRGIFELNNQKYLMYSGWIDKSKENLGVDGWNYIAFIKVNRTEANSLDIKEVLDILISRGDISKESYLVQGELGNEVFNANGVFTLGGLEVDM